MACRIKGEDDMKRLFWTTLTGLLFLLMPMITFAADNTWTGDGPFKTGLGNRVITAIAVDPTNPDLIYAGTGSGTIFSYHQVKPVVTTGAATSVTSAGATLSATVNAKGADTAITFEYGPDTTYGSTVTASPDPVTGTTDTAVIAATGILSPGVTYHYRAKGENPAGTTYGDDLTFTTLKADQTITVTTNAPLYATHNTSFNVSATAGSGKNVAITTSGVCSGSGTGSATITMTSGTGMCTVHYNQAGDANYNAAPEVKESTTAQKASQTITPHAPVNATYNTSFNVSATASSEQNVAITTSGVCSGSGTGSASVTMTSGTGTCTVHYNQAGDGNYDAASEATKAVNAQRAATATTFSASVHFFSSPPPSVTFTAAVTSDRGTPAGTVTFKNGGSAIAGCTDLALSSGSATCTTSAFLPGVYDITAEYSGNPNFMASASGVVQVSTVITVDLIETSVSNPPAIAVLGSSFSITDTAKNQGNTEAGASTTRYYLSSNTVKDGSDTLLTGSRSMPALAAGATSTGTVDVIVPITTPVGTYYLLACADDMNGVKENEEANNCLPSGLTAKVIASDLNFYDDYGRGRLCVNSITGDWTYTILTGVGAGNTYTGSGSFVRKGNILWMNTMDSERWGINLVYNDKAKKAMATFGDRASGVRSSLVDADTTDNPGDCD
jgi:hypothetical protein